MFAKLFDTEEFGQIVVLNQTDDGGNPQLAFLFNPRGLGVCTIAVNFTNGDEEKCAAAADAAFDSIDEAAACNAVRAVTENWPSEEEDDDDEL